MTNGGPFDNGAVSLSGEARRELDEHTQELMRHTAEHRELWEYVRELHRDVAELRQQLRQLCNVVLTLVCLVALVGFLGGLWFWAQR